MIREDPRERLTFYRPTTCPGVEILDAVDSFEPWHVFHEQYAVCAVKMAATNIKYRSKVEACDDLSVSFFEPGEVHRNLKVHKRSDFKVLFIRPDVFERAAAEMSGHTPHFDLFPASGDDLFKTVYSYCHSVESGAEVLEQQSRLARCIGHFMRCAERPVKAETHVDESAIRRARSYLMERYNQAITLEELATASGISKFHLAHAFAKRLGLPPHAFQVHVRIERARGLLRRGLLPVEVAMIVGFADQSHLTRHFKRMWGITPAAYARLHQASGVSFAALRTARPARH
jgi:AraC-like DNA-binding protein